MKRYIIILIVLLSLASCTKHSEHWETLTQVESYIEEGLDSALVVLQGVDNEQLANDEERAKHALVALYRSPRRYGRPCNPPLVEGCNGESCHCGKE